MLSFPRSSTTAIGRGAYASNSIFLPAAGYGYGTSLHSSGSRGDYWSAVPYSGIDGAYELGFLSGYHYTDYLYSRHSGRSVRPVQGLAK